MADKSGLGILRVSMSGDPVHAEHSQIPGTEEAHAAMLAKGTRTLGPLWYSLLRSDSHAKMHYRRRVLARLVAERDQLDLEYARLLARRAASHGDPWDRNRGLVTWDLIGALGEFCESLAATYSAHRASVAGRDGGRAMLDFDAPPHKVFRTLEFGDIETWERDLDADDATVESLKREMPPELVPTYERWMGHCRGQVREAVRAVQQGYTHELHRLAQRRKHAVSYVSPWHGYIWVPEERPERDLFDHAMVDGAFVVLDSDAEWVVPSTRDTFERLLGTAEQASWLISALSAAILGRAEHPTSRSLLFPSRIEPVATNDEALEITRIVTGTDQRTTVEAGAWANDHRDAIAAGTRVPRQGRNELCACGSGRKFKRCHGRA